MHFPKFWSRAEFNSFSAWSWSDLSFEDAKHKAAEAAKRLADLFTQNKLSQRDYGYADRPLREEVLKELADAVITRNAMGCEILNTDKLAFIDIDFPEKKVGFFATLFGKGRVDNSQIDALREKIHAWIRVNPSWGMRLYRTKGGARLIVTHQFLSPDSAAVDDVFKKLGADPLYQKLCASQKSFRARLTPKPFRCQIRSAPARWPWLSAADEQAFRSWDETYKNKASKFACCKFLEHFGDTSMDQQIRALIEMHDAQTRALSELPLA